FGAGDVTAATFNGTSSYAEIPFKPGHSSADRAIELWFKTAKPGVIAADQYGAPSGSAPAGDWNPLLYVGADNKLHGHWYTVASSGTPAFGTTNTVTDNKWHHAVLSISGTTQTMYL